MAVLQRATGKHAGSIFIFIFNFEGPKVMRETRGHLRVTYSAVDFRSVRVLMTMCRYPQARLFFRLSGHCWARCHVLPSTLQLQREPVGDGFFSSTKDFESSIVGMTTSNLLYIPFRRVHHQFVDVLLLVPSPHTVPTIVRTLQCLIELSAILWTTFRDKYGRPSKGYCFEFIGSSFAF